MEFNPYVPDINHDIVEDKQLERLKLEKLIAEFELKGGKIETVSPGASTAVDTVLMKDKLGNPVSGIENVVWDGKREQWRVTAFGRKRPLGYVDKLEDAVKLKRKYADRMNKLIKKR